VAVGLVEAVLSGLDVTLGVFAGDPELEVSALIAHHRKSATTTMATITKTRRRQ
jgi:hypothetical protein